MKNIKNKKVKIKGKRIYLKTLNIKNATKEYCSWLNDPKVNRYLETRKTTIDEVKKYIKEKNKNPNCLFLGIFLKENNKHIGNIKLEPINFSLYNTTLGLLVGDKNYWGRGIGTEATKLLVNYAFQKLNLKEVNLVVISENIAALKVHEKVGFKVDKIERNSIRHGKKLFDTVWMSIKQKDIGQKNEEG